MFKRLGRAQRAIPMVLGVATMAGVVALLVWDAFPNLFPPAAHNFLGAFPLAMIALAYLAYQAAHQPSAAEWAKAITLAVAFLFWAANQCLPNPHQAIVSNDIAIALFVLDLFLVIVGWPSTAADGTEAPDASFGEG